MAKIGRNEKCPCGSGKKYKHCHGSIVHLEQFHDAMTKMQHRAEADQVQQQRQQGLGKPIISTETSSGHRFVAVKNRLLHSKSWKTFPDFLGDYIKIALDPEWRNAELAKPPERRHPILDWYQKLCAHQKTYITEPGKVSDAPMTGAVAAYLHLAYDLYALDHNAELQNKLVARLHNHDNLSWV
jgi:SEC-C motif